MSPELLKTAATCAASSTCDSGPFACLGSALSSAGLTPAQKTTVSDYCSNCSDLPSDACQAAFVASDGSPGPLGYLLLPVGDTIAAKIDQDCTSSSLGATACQAAFTTCAELALTKAATDAVSADSATCLAKALTPSGGGNGDGGTTGDGGSSSDGGGGTCNSLANTAPSVAIQTISGTVPSPTGGTIVDGTYYLTSYQRYDGSTTACTGYPSTMKQTRVIAGGTYQAVEQDDAKPEFTTGGVYTISDKTYTRSQNCPSSDTTSFGISADANSFTLIDTTCKDASLYTKQ